MVLRSIKTILLFLPLVLVAGCLTRGAPVRANTPQELFLVFVHDDNTAPPKTFQERVTSELSNRGFTVRVSSKIKPEDEWSTSLLLSNLKSEAAGKQLMIVSTNGQFFSQLEGRFRWTVRVTAISANPGESSITRMSLPAILNFGHQDSQDALNLVSASIAKRLGDIASTYANEANALEKNKSGQKPLKQTKAERQAADSIYFVMLDRFSNGDKSNDEQIDLDDPNAFHGGDLRGLINKLDYIKEMGFQHVWVSPVFKMRTKPFHGHGAFHGYWTEDINKVEPRFGSEAELIELSKELKARGMGLILDVVLNHVAYDSPLVTEKPNWFHQNGTIKDWNDAKQLTDFEVHGLPDYAHENTEVRQTLIAASHDWLSKLQPSGFRLDAVKHVPMDFWTEYNRFIKGQSDIRLLGELYDGNVKTISNAMEGTYFDSFFDFPLHFAMVDAFCRDSSLLQMASVLSLDRMYPGKAEKLVTFLDNHDLSRILSACNDEEARVHSALQFLLSSRGVPSISYGTESALRGAKEPDNRGDMRFEVHALASTIREGLSLRRQWKSLTSGSRLLLTANERLYSFVRVNNDELTLVTVNLGETSVAVPTPKALSGHQATNLRDGTVVDLGQYLAPKGVSLVGVRGDFSSLRKKLTSPHSRQLEFTVDQAGQKLDLRVVGAAPEFGAWNPNNAPKLNEGVRLPSAEAYSYKLVAMQEGKAKWQAGGNNYLFVPQGDSPMKVAVQWRE